MRLILCTLIFLNAAVAYAAMPNSGTCVSLKESEQFGQPVKCDAAKILKKVDVPTLEFYPTEDNKPHGIVIICPGGAYNVLMTEHEGSKIAKEFNARGICAAVLRYSVPNVADKALADLRAAIKLLRQNAVQWNIKPDKIAVMGFSAGANLCARASADASLEVSAEGVAPQMPNLACIIYPAYCVESSRAERFDGKSQKPSGDYTQRYELAKNLKISKSTPPTFIMQTGCDVYGDSAIAYYLALKNAKIPTELHIFYEGAHGVGVNKTDLPVGVWPQLCAQWLLHNGINK